MRDNKSCVILGLPCDISVLDATIAKQFVLGLKTDVQGLVSDFEQYGDGNEYEITVFVDVQRKVGSENGK